MITNESFVSLLLHVFINGEAVYVGVCQDEEDEGEAGGDSTWTFTDPYVTPDGAEAALTAAHEAKLSSPAGSSSRSSIPICSGVLLELELEGGDRILARFGQYSVMIFNEGTLEEFCLVFGPGNRVVCNGPLNDEEALELAEALMLADEHAVSLEDEVASPSP